MNNGYKNKLIKKLSALCVTQKIHNQHVTHIQCMTPNKVKNKISYGLVRQSTKRVRRKIGPQVNSRLMRRKHEHLVNPCNEEGAPTVHLPVKASS